MNRVGIRELRQNASALLRRVAAGETFEVTDRGRPVAMLVRVGSEGLARLEREGLIRAGTGDLLTVRPAALPPGSRLPSDLVGEARDE